MEVPPDARVYQRRHLRVVTGVEDGEWHIAVSSLRMGTVSDAELERVRVDFGVPGAIEPQGVVACRRVRHLWLSALAMVS